MLIRYDFTIDENSTNPQLLYFIKDDCFYAYEKEECTHLTAEIVFVISGKGNAIIDKTVYPLKANCMYFINPNLPHGEFIEKGQGFTYYILGVKNCYFPIFKQTIFQFNENDFIPRLFHEFFNEIHEKKTFWQSAYQHYFNLLIVYLKRCYNMDNVEAPIIYSDEIAKIKNYIDVNFCGDISSKTIAIEFNLLQNSINKKFKKYMGQSIQEYILHLRINNAKYWLKNTSLSISKVATKCGFNSPAYFSKYFKKVTSISPIEYRQEQLKKLLKIKK